ncbi:cytochrome P450 [Aspergillus karnatakaensis]|uniref:cytochrome P450 n=1 Tax=Aspergillus karnatakaensis TaxID=1810916 RepID=UPI003CCDF385
MISILLGCAVLYLITWRVWRFTVRPSLNPEEPEEVPYWIPCIKRFNNSRSPFLVTLFGSPLYIISDPVDVSEVNRQFKAFNLEPLAQEMLLKFEISKPSVENLFRPIDGGKRAGPLHAIDKVIDVYRQHISPGKELDNFVQGDIIPRFAAILSQTEPGLSTDQTITISLHKLCAQALINGVVGAYYGDIIHKIQPNFAGRYMAWETTSWKFLMGLPKFLSRDMLAAKDDMIGLFVEYFSLPPKKRGHSNFWVSSVEHIFRDLDLTTEEIARMFMLHTSSIVGNMYKLSFWLLAHILHDQHLLRSITLEIKPANNLDTQAVDHTYLTENCPLLDSLYSEVLRLIVTSPMTRYVSQTSTIGGKTLKEGSKVLIIYRQLHLDRATWGPTPQILQPDRFLHDKTLKTKVAYRPWGGGKHVCPGRYLAKKAVFSFIALCLGQYEVELDRTAGDQAFPGADLAKASGVANIADGEDVMVSVRRRA